MVFALLAAILLVSSTVMITGAGYLINDYYDVKIDLVNKPKRVVVGKDLKRRWVIVGHTFLNLSAIAIGFKLSITIGLINFAAAFLLEKGCDRDGMRDPRRALRDSRHSETPATPRECPPWQNLHGTAPT